MIIAFIPAGLAALGIITSLVQKEYILAGGNLLAATALILLAFWVRSCHKKRFGKA